MENNQAWDDTQEKQMQAEIKAEVDKAVEDYLNMPDQPASAMFDYLYETLPEAYQDQREEVIAYHGGDA